MRFYCETSKGLFSNIQRTYSYKGNLWFIVMAEKFQICQYFLQLRLDFICILKFNKILSQNFKFNDKLGRSGGGGMDALLDLSFYWELVKLELSKKITIYESWPFPQFGATDVENGGLEISRKIWYCLNLQTFQTCYSNVCQSIYKEWSLCDLYFLSINNFARN